MTQPARVAKCAKCILVELLSRVYRFVSLQVTASDVSGLDRAVSVERYELSSLARRRVPGPVVCRPKRGSLCSCSRSSGFSLARTPFGIVELIFPIEIEE